MDASGTLNLQLSMAIDGLLVHEHHLPIDGRVTIGRELRGNLITWHKLPPSLTLLESRAGKTLLNLHPALVIRLHRAGHIQRLANTGQITLLRQDRVEIDLQGASLELEFYDPATMPAVTVPRAVREIDLTHQSRVIKGILSAAVITQFAFLLLPKLPEVDLQRDPVRPPAVAEKADTQEEAGDEQFDRWVSEHALEDTAETSETLTDAEVAARVVLPEPVRREKPELEAELESLLEAPTSDVFANAASDAMREDGKLLAHDLASAARTERGGMSARVSSDIGSMPALARASRGIAIDIQDVARHRPERRTERLIAPGDVKVFHDAILRRRSSFQHCYETKLKSNSDLAGRITLHFRVQPAGHHSKIVAIKAETDEVGGGVADCMMRVMSKMKLPLPAEDTDGLDTGMSFVFAVGD
jgi:hypothetical protein